MPSSDSLTGVRLRLSVGPQTSPRPCLEPVFQFWARAGLGLSGLRSASASRLGGLVHVDCAGGFSHCRKLTRLLSPAYLARPHAPARMALRRAACRGGHRSADVSSWGARVGGRGRSVDGVVVRGGHRVAHPAGRSRRIGARARSAARRSSGNKKLVTPGLTLCVERRVCFGGWRLHRQRRHAGCRSSKSGPWKLSRDTCARRCSLTRRANEKDELGAQSCIAGYWTARWPGIPEGRHISPQEPFQS